MLIHVKYINMLKKRKKNKFKIFKNKIKNINGSILEYVSVKRFFYNKIK